MTDIVERLRYPVGVHPEQLQQWCIEAADEIERPRADMARRNEADRMRAQLADDREAGHLAEIERLTAGNAAVDAQFRIWRERAEKAEAEIEQLRAERDSHWSVIEDAKEQIERLTAENDELRAALRDATGLDIKP